MKTKFNVMKKLTLFAAAFAFCAVLCAKPVDVKAALTAPTGLEQTDASSSAVYVAWDDTAEYYCVEYSTDRKTWKTSYTKTASNSVVITGLTAGTTYYVKITPIDGSTKGNNSAILIVDTAPNNTSKVTQTAAEEKSITVSWPASTGATGYAIYVGNSSSASSAELYKVTTATNIKMTTTSTNVAFYTFVVPYRGDYWTSSSYYYTKVVTAPTAPTAWVYSTKAGTNQVTFTCEPTSYTDNTSGYDFEVYRVTNKNGKTKKLKTVDTKSKYQYDAVVKNNNLFKAGYKYRVRAYVTINGKKMPGSWSNFYYGTPSAKIKGKLKNQTSSTATLSWNKVLGAKSYTVWHKTSEYAKWKKVKKNVKGTSATVKYSKSSTYNYYYVQANSAKIDKKKVSSVNPNSGKAYSYSVFKKVYSWY